jgi:hypothetical protein
MRGRCTREMVDLPADAWALVTEFMQDLDGIVSLAHCSRTVSAGVSAWICGWLRAFPVGRKEYCTSGRVICFLERFVAGKLRRLQRPARYVTREQCYAIRVCRLHVCWEDQQCDGG